MPTSRIFVIDNDQQTITDLKSRLTKLGYDVVGTATTPREAIEKTALLQPNLILMNTHLRSGIDGIKTGKLLHSKSDTQIIYFSSHAGQETIRLVGSTGQ